MTGVLVDSNVLLDVLTEDPVWYQWSSSALADCLDESLLFINTIVYAEVSIRFETIEEMETEVSRDIFRRLPIPAEAAFLAGKAFQRYRKSGGTRHSVLPDFFIGAHAAVSGMQLLTRDSRLYRTYFPTVRFISPE